MEIAGQRKREGRKMDIQLIALDLDRTTLDGQGRLSEANRAAITRAIEKGVHVAVATGRAFSTIPVTSTASRSALAGI